MKPPRFWQTHHTSFWQAILWPASVFYRLGAEIRRAMTKPVSVDATVLCVGNVTMGGAGKTPVVIALAKAAALQRVQTAVVSRGYGGNLPGPVRVDPARHTASDVGDEPLLLAAHVETWVSRDRVRGAAAAEQAGAELILLDDGFQNPTLNKDYSLLVFDGGSGIGNGSVFPAGPLREPVDSALGRADMCLVIGDDRWKLAGTVLKDARVQMASLVPDSATDFDKGGRYHAFAGIGIPEKFFQTLREMGLELSGANPYADHYQYTLEDMKSLASEARQNGSSLITTRKDFVRVPGEYADQVRVLDVALKCDAEDAFERVIREAMGNG